jgi:hypothetical protein
VDDSMQSVKNQPPAEAGSTDTNGVPATRKRRVLSWEEWMELKSHYRDNRCAFPSEKLLALVGQTLAWEPDGSAIRESGSSHREVTDKIKAQGDDPSLYTFEYIPII